MHFDNNLLRLLIPFRTPFILTILAGWLLGTVTVGQAWLMSQAIYQVFLLKQTFEDVKNLIFLLIIILIFRSILRYFQYTGSHKLAIEITSQLRLKLMDKITQLGPVYTQDKQSGELVTLAMQGLETLEPYFGEYLPALMMAAVIPLTVLSIVLPLDWLSGLILIVTAPLIPFFMVLIGKSSEKLTKRQWKVLNQLGAFFLDTVRGLTTLKILNRIEDQGNEISRTSDEYRIITINILKIAFLSALALEMLATLSTAFIAVQIGLRLLEGQMGFQQALFILVITPDFYQPLRTLGQRFHSGISAVEVSRQLFSLLSTAHPLSNSNPVIATPIPVGTVIQNDDHDLQKLTSPVLGKMERKIRTPQSLEFKNVSFSYPLRPEAALERVTFTLAPGTVTLLSGSSGVGKSTIIHLILRLIEPNNGAITWRGSPIQDFPVKDWRRMISWGAQTPYIFNKTLLENIVMDAAIDQERLHEVTRLTCLDPLVKSLAEGFNTLTGEGGIRFSSGQNQRISLARAFYRQAPIMLLDEPLLYLDRQIATDIIHSVQAISRDRITLIVSHQIETPFQVDQVLEVQDGQVMFSSRNLEPG